MAPGLYRYIWSRSAPEQVRIILLTLSSFPFLYAALDLPKHIVNKAISARGMGEGIYGYLPAEQISHLFALCAVFLFLTLFNGFFKFLINTRTSRLGERVVTTLRGELYQRLLRRQQNGCRAYPPANSSQSSPPRPKCLGASSATPWRYQSCRAVRC